MIGKIFQKLKNIYFWFEDKWNNFIKLKYINVIFKFLPHNMFVFLLLIFSIVTLFKFNIYSANEYVPIYEQNNLFENIGPILEKTRVDLSFVDNLEGEFSNICFRVDTYDRSNNLEITLQVLKDDDILIQEVEETKDLIKGDYLCFDSNNEKLETFINGEVFLIPEYEVTEDNAISIYQNDDGEVAVSFVNIQNENLKYFSIICFVIFIGIYFFVNYLINKKKIVINNFLVLMLLYMVPILFIMPSYQVPDEPVHFYRAYNLSQYDASEGIYQGFLDINLELPENISCLNYASLQVGDKVTDFNDIKECFRSEDNTDANSIVAGNGAILGYLVPGIGIKLADLFTNSPMLIFYTGRLLNFCFSFLLIYLAIKITPKYKSIFLIVSTMMMFIQQAISFSYDSILNAMALLFVAYILKFIYDDEKIKFRDWLLMIGILTILVNIKGVTYLPLMLMFLLIPKNKFKNGKNKNKYFTFILSIILVLILYKAIGAIVNIGHVDMASNASEDTTLKQLNYLLDNPVNIFKVAYNTIKIKGLLYLNGIIGFFGWFEFKISDKYILVYALLFAYVIMSEKSKFKLKDRAIVLGSVFISCVGICAAMYLYWSEYMFPYVEGVQGRYFIPLLLPFMLVFIPRKNYFKINYNIIYGCINILLLQYILTLTLWYY